MTNFSKIPQIDFFRDYTTKHTAKHQPTPHMTKSCPNTCLFSPHMTNTQPTFSSYQKPTCTRFFPIAILHFSKLHELHGHNMTIRHITNNTTIMLCSTNNDSASSLYHISHPHPSHTNPVDTAPRNNGQRTSRIHVGR